MRPAILSLFLAAGAVAAPRRPCPQTGGRGRLSAASRPHRGSSAPVADVPEATAPKAVVAQPDETEDSVPEVVATQAPASNNSEEESSPEVTVPDSDESEGTESSDPVSEEPATEPPAESPASGGTPSVSGLPSGWKPGVKWQIVIDDPVDITKTLDPPDAQVWVVDYFHSAENPEIIPHLKSPSTGIENVVLCYINVGAIQESESDYSSFPSSAIGNSYDGYPEWWIDTSSSAVIDFMKKRLAKAAEVGCDGIDADNIDGWDADGAYGGDKTGFGLTKAQSVAYVQTLASYAHTLTTKRGLPLMFGQKNSQQLIPDLADYVDFAVLENCQGSGDWCGEFQPFVTGSARSDGAKLPVFDIEYPDSSADATSVSPSDWEHYCNRDPASIGNANFSTIIKRDSGQLDGWVQYCESSASEGVYSTTQIQWN